MESWKYKMQFQRLILPLALSAGCTQLSQKSMNLKIGQQKLYILKSKKKKRVKNRTNCQKLWDNINQSNIHIIEVPRGEKKREWKRRNAAIFILF